MNRAVAWLGAIIAIGALSVPSQAAAAGTSGTYVRLGDSYASGPLIPNQHLNPVGCLRSDHNYPSLVAGVIHARSFRDVSCSGATTVEMTSPQQVPLGTNPPQLSALPARATLVTLTIGRHDIGFGS